jgi:hypothetical protein
VLGELARKEADLGAQHARRNVENSLVFGITHGQAAGLTDHGTVVLNRSIVG